MPNLLGWERIIVFGRDWPGIGMLPPDVMRPFGSLFLFAMIDYDFKPHGKVWGTVVELETRGTLGVGLVEDGRGRCSIFLWK